MAGKGYMNGRALVSNLWDRTTFSAKNLRDQLPSVSLGSNALCSLFSAKNAPFFTTSSSAFTGYTTPYRKTMPPASLSHGSNCLGSSFGQFSLNIEALSLRYFSAIRGLFAAYTEGTCVNHDDEARKNHRRGVTTRGYCLENRTGVYISFLPLQNAAFRIAARSNSSFPRGGSLQGYYSNKPEFEDNGMINLGKRKSMYPGDNAARERFYESNGNAFEAINHGAADGYSTTQEKGMQGNRFPGTTEGGSSSTFLSNLCFFGVSSMVMFRPQPATFSPYVASSTGDSTVSQSTPISTRFQMSQNGVLFCSFLPRLKGSRQFDKTKRIDIAIPPTKVGGFLLPLPNLETTSLPKFSYAIECSSQWSIFLQLVPHGGISSGKNASPGELNLNDFRMLLSAVPSEPGIEQGSIKASEEGLAMNNEVDVNKSARQSSTGKSPITVPLTLGEYRTLQSMLHAVLPSLLGWAVTGERS